MRTNSFQTERGMALILSLVMATAIMGVLASLLVFSQMAATESQNRLDYSLALQVPETGLHEALYRISTTSITTSPANPATGSTNFEYIGFVGQQRDTGSFDTRTIYGSVDGNDYVARVRSSYFAHITQARFNPPESNPAVAADGYLRAVSWEERGDLSTTKDSTGSSNFASPVFDVYQITAYTTKFQRSGSTVVLGQNGMPIELQDGSRGIGRHEFRRGVTAVVEARKTPLPSFSAMYIDGDPSPQWAGGSWRISGADHAMVAAGSESTCPDCSGTGVVSGTATYCNNCGGDGAIDVTCSDATVAAGCKYCNGSGRLAKATLSPLSHCATCNDAYVTQQTCPVCAGYGWLVAANSAPLETCPFCNNTRMVLIGHGNSKKMVTCIYCKACANCTDGKINISCPDCASCTGCGGNGKVSAICTAGCANGWIGAAMQACSTCGGDGKVVSSVSGGGQPDESDYLKANGTNTAAVGYPNTYAQLNVGDGTQISTVKDGVSVMGESAFNNAKIDMRALAASFVGSPVADPLQPTRCSVSTSFESGNVGDMDNFKLTYIRGDAGTISGTNTGGGVLIIDGNAKISGQFTWYGLIIVLGSLEISGGGNGVHIFGSVMGAELASSGDSKVGGQTDIWWSQDAMNKVLRDIPPQMSVYPRVLAWNSLDKAAVQNLEP